MLCRESSRNKAAPPELFLKLKDNRGGVTFCRLSATHVRLYSLCSSEVRYLAYPHRRALNSVLYEVRKNSNISGGSFPLAFPFKINFFSGIFFSFLGLISHPLWFMSIFCLKEGRLWKVIVETGVMREGVWITCPLHQGCMEPSKSRVGKVYCRLDDGWEGEFTFPRCWAIVQILYPHQLLKCPSLLWPWQSAASLPQQLWSVVSVTLSERNKLCGVCCPNG